jgi:ABC-2 type transport system permease protein
MSSVELPRPAVGLPLLASELLTLFRRRRTWAMLAALSLIPILIGIAIRVAGGASPGRGPAFLDQIAGNGLFVSLTALVVATPLFLPLTISVVAGDSIAGEASLGTLRYLLIAPAGRMRLLAVKYLVAAAFCVAGALTVVVVGTLVGWVLFPIGPVTLLSGGQVSVGDGVLRILAIGAYVAVSMLGLSAMAATAILAVSTQIAGAIPQLEWLHPWLFTDRWFDFDAFLRSPPDWGPFIDNALVQAAYLAVFGGAAAWRFATSDILS